MKSSVNRIALVLMLGLVVSVGAQAQFEWEISSQAGPDGFVVNDLYYTPQSTNPVMEMLTVGLEGQIYQEGVDIVVPCGPPLTPTTNADTFVTMGGDTFATLPAGLLIAGGAVDIGGDPAPQCDEDVVNMAWTPGAGQFLEPPGVRRLMARLTVAEAGVGSDSWGQVIVFVQDGNETRQATFPIPIPEPSSVAMLAMGLLCFLRRRM